MVKPHFQRKTFAFGIQFQICGCKEIAPVKLHDLARADDVLVADGAHDGGGGHERARGGLEADGNGAKGGGDEQGDQGGRTS